MAGVASRSLPNRLYERLGWKLVPATVVIQAITAVITLAAGAFTLVVGYLDGSFGEYAEYLAWTLAAVLVGGLTGTLVSWRLARPALLWIRQPADPTASAEQAWLSLHHWLNRTIVSITLGVALLACPVSFAYLIPNFDVHGWEIFGQFVALVTGISFGFALVLLIGETLMRPILADISKAVAPGWAPPRTRWNVRTKAIVLLPAFVLMTIGVAVGFVPDDATREARLAAASLGGMGALLLIGLPAIHAATGTILEPLKALERATARVAQGDLSQPVALTTADEFGAVVAGFNRLQQRVGEQLEELRDSRARIVAASDAERRRVERNLHDGAQQRLVALALQLSMLEDGASDDAQRALALKSREDLSQALAELRELARGLHPQVLTTGGLKPAIEQLAERAPLPVTVQAPAERYPDPVESTAYFVVSEALTNVAKYAEASAAEVTAGQVNGSLVVSISDDGKGGADLAAGSGLSGLADRVAALDGELSVESPPSRGTLIRARLPLGQEAEC